MSRETVTLAILFADIAKSTHLYEVLGDTIARNLISACISLLTEITEKYKGTLIKTIGDEIMCTFPTANTAVEAAMEMHEALEEMTVEGSPGASPPNIYVGIHYGPVIREGGDVFGDAVNIAARMVSQAKQRQIITTEETVEQLSPDLQDEAQCIDKTTIKGKSGELKIYEVVWEHHDVTMMVDSDFGAVEIKARMELAFQNQTFEIDENHPASTLGRQSHNEVVVRDNRVSRSHARIEYRRGKFVLIDQSSNGTFVSIQGKKELILKRDEVTLQGNGFIALGQKVAADSPLAIQYDIKL